ncbi:amidohydrolase [Candidatus Marinimicrobia bacterium]|nr:amidohydrolase [Candidatus Neomarinimicrobiota bacterium]
MGEYIINIKNLIILTFSFFLLKCASIETADIIYFNGNIYTGIKEDTRQNYIATKNNRILELGIDNYSHLISSNTKLIDLKNNFLLPGFIDNHTHFIYGGTKLNNISLQNSRTQYEFINSFREYIPNINNGLWLQGGNWDHENWGGALPNKSWIDSLTNNNPVLVIRVDGHMALANSKALEEANINENTPNPVGGEIVKDINTGIPTGILKDTAIDIVRKLIPKQSHSEQDSILKTSMNYASSQGITQIHDMATWDDLQTFRRNKDKLTLRIKTYTWYEDWEKLIDLIDKYGKGDNILRWDGIKAMIDGSLGSRTAWMHNHYLDDKNTNGIMRIKDTNSFKKMITNLDKNGIQLAIHAIGDKANDWIIKQSMNLSKVNGFIDRRIRIEHAQHLTKDAIEKIINNDIIPSMQPYGCIDDTRWMHKRINSDLMSRTYIFKTFIDKNVNLTFGSDWDVTPLNPLFGIYAAVSRKTIDGSNPGGWNPEQKLTVEEAISCYTNNNSYAVFSEKNIGVLQKDMLADFVVLSKDITSIKIDDILKTRVLNTIYNGKEVFRAFN